MRRLFAVVFLLLVVVFVVVAPASQASSFLITTKCFSKPCHAFRERDVIVQPDRTSPWMKIPLFISLTQSFQWYTESHVQIDGHVMSCHRLEHTVGPALRRWQPQVIEFVDGWWGGELHCLQTTFRDYEWFATKTTTTAAALTRWRLELTDDPEHNQRLFHRGELIAGPIVGYKSAVPFLYETLGNNFQQQNAVDVTVLFLESFLQHKGFASRLPELQSSLVSVAYFRTCPVRFHIVTDSLSTRLPVADQLTNIWFLGGNHYTRFASPSVSVDQYAIESMPWQDWLRNIQTFDDAWHRDALKKLILEKILPDTVQQSIFLDYDTIVVQDVCAMARNVFSEMKQQHPKAWMAMVPEMASYYRDRQGKIFAAPIPPALQLYPDEWGTAGGLNTGVIFANLSRMRTERWDLLWTSEVERVNNIAQEPSVHYLLFELGDQNVFNLVFRKHPQYVYVLDHSFNFQLAHLQPPVLQALVCKLASRIQILHGNSAYFLQAKALGFKTRIWDLFANLTRPHEEFMLFDTIPNMLREWQVCSTMSK